MYRLIAILNNMKRKTILQVNNAYVECRFREYYNNTYTFIDTNIPYEILKDMIPYLNESITGEPYTTYRVFSWVMNGHLIAGGIHWDKQIYITTSLTEGKFHDWLMANDENLE